MKNNQSHQEIPIGSFLYNDRSLVINASSKDRSKVLIKDFGIFDDNTNPVTFISDEYK